MMGPYQELATKAAEAWKRARIAEHIAHATDATRSATICGESIPCGVAMRAANEYAMRLKLSLPYPGLGSHVNQAKER